MSEFFFHGIRKADDLPLIQQRGFSRGFFTTERDIAERFAVSGYILAIDAKKIPKADLKVTRYIFDGMPGAQIEYIGQAPIPPSDFELIRLDPLRSET